MSRKARALLLVFFLALMINLPLVHSSWTQRKVSNNGVDVVAVVTNARILAPADDPTYVVEFTFPEEIDSTQTWTVQVTQASYERAEQTEQIDVRVLADQPAAFRVEGQVVGRLALIVTLGADVLLALGALLLGRHRGRRGDVVLRATEDVARCKPGSSLERREDNLYVAQGEICSIEDGVIVLELGDRQVRVDLDGHHNPVGYQQPAQVTGVLLR